MNAYINFGEFLSICSQDIERKQNFGVNINAFTKFGEICRLVLKILSGNEI